MCLAPQEGGELGPVLPPDDSEGKGVDHQATDDPAADGEPLPGGLLLPGGDDRPAVWVTCSQALILRQNVWESAGLLLEGSLFPLHVLAQVGYMAHGK